MPEPTIILDPLMEQYNRVENEGRLGVVVQEIGGRHFLEVNNNVVGVDELSRYRKVFIVNNIFYIYLYIALSTIDFVVLLFTRSLKAILFSLLSVICSIVMLFLVKRVMKHYSYISCGAMILGVVSCWSVLNSVTAKTTAAIISIIVFLVCIIQFFVLMMLSFVLTRLQTIFRIVPQHCT